MRSSLGRGRVGLFALAFALVILAGLASFYASYPSRDVPAVIAPSAGRALVATAGLAAILVALVSLGLVRREQALRRHTETRLSRFLESADRAGEMVTIVDRKGRIEYANRAVALTTGYEGGDLFGSPAGRWFPWYADERVSRDLSTTLLAGRDFRGTVRCRRKDGSPFLLEDHVAPLQERRGSTTRFVSTARDVTRQRETEERLVQLARYDTLTGAPNRGHFTELLETDLAQRLPGDRRLVVLVLDIDRFKYINDVFTFDVGDEMLRRVADILRSLAGPGAVVGRLGSDEFGVIHRGPAQTPDAGHALAASVLRSLARNTKVAGHELAATASVGIACSPEDGSDAATLLRNADIALSFAKAVGRNSVRSFSAELGTRLVELYSIQRHVADALRKSEYQVHYQPYCDLGTGQMSGAEALIRWNSQDLGPVPPVKFIPALEDSGLILEVGEWVLRTACRQIRDWKRTHQPLPIAVNLSHIQFGHRDLVGLVDDAVRESDIDPRHLTLELTESICIHDIGFAAELLTRLKGVGVSISVDDFGTGYSSLSYVKKLPVDSLKIDMSFVRDVTRDPDAASIITAITTMARGLGLKTIAEGVETPEQANILHLLRCDMGQGYHFGRAMAADAFERRVAEPPAP